MQKFLKSLDEAEKIIQTADYLIYRIFPIVKDKRLLLKILAEIKIAIVKCINSILQYEYLYKRVKLHKAPKTNFKTFIDKCAQRYQITEEEIRIINELFEVVEKHKQSPFVFMKDDKIVILLENSTQKIISIEKTKEFLGISKNVLRKAQSKILRKI
jgi:hypothetical protein